MKQSILISKNFNNQHIFYVRKENFERTVIEIKKINYINAFFHFISFGYIPKDPEEASLFQIIKSTLKIHEFASLRIKNAVIEELKRIKDVDNEQLKKNIAFLNQKIIKDLCEKIELSNKESKALSLTSMAPPLDPSIINSEETSHSENSNVLNPILLNTEKDPQSNPLQLQNSLEEEEDWATKTSSTPSHPSKSNKTHCRKTVIKTVMTIAALVFTTFAVRYGRKIFFSSPPNQLPQENWETSIDAFGNNLEVQWENYRELRDSLPDDTLKQELTLLSKEFNDLKEKTSCKTEVSSLCQQELQKKKIAFKRFKQHLQEEKERIEDLSPSGKNLKHLVSDDPQVKCPFPVDDKTLLHVLGDRFGHKSGKEGSSESAALGYLKEFFTIQEGLGFTHFPNKVFKEKLTIAQRLLEFIHPTIDLDLPEQELQKTFNQRAREFSQALRKECEMLEVGDTIFFPGGWFGKEGGHAIMHEVLRESKTTFRIRTINTGAGIETYHSSKIQHYNQRFIPFVDMTHVSLEALTLRHFARAMIEMRVALKAPNDPNQEIEWGAEDVYMRMLSALGGQMALPNSDEEDWMDPQFAGTCSFRGKMALFRRHMSPKQYLRFEFELSAWTLKQYLIHNKDALNEQIKRNLLRKSAETFSRFVLNYFDKNVISEEELEISQSLVQEVLSEVNRAKQNLIIKLDQEAPLIDVDKPLQKAQIKDVNHVIDSSNSIPVFYFFDYVSTPDSNHIPIKPYHALDLTNWTISPENLILDLQNFVKLSKQAYRDKNYQAITDFTSALYQKIPLMEIEEGAEIWKKLDSKEKQQALHSLSEMSELFFKSCFNVPESIRATPQRFMVMLRAATLFYQLTKDLPKDLGVPDSLHPFTENFFKNVRDSVYFRTYDPELDRQFFKIHAMLHKTKIPYTKHTLAKGTDFISIPKNWSPHTNSTEIGEKEIQFIANLIVKPTIATKLRQKYPNYDSLSFTEKILTAYTDPDETILPPVFYALRKQNFYMNYFFQGIFGNSPGFQLKDDSYQFKYNFYFNSYANTFQITLSLEGIHIYNALNAYSEFDRKSQDKKYGETNTGHRFELSQKKIQNPSLQAVINKPRMDDNQVVLLKEAEGPLLLKNYKELLLLRSKPSLQLTRSLAYFKRNYELLTQIDYQTLLNLLIFEPGLLNEQLSQSTEREAFTLQLSEFIQKGFSHFYDRGDIDSCIYFLRLNRRLKSYVDDNQATQPDPSTPSSSLFYPTRKKLQELLKKASISETTKTLIHREIAASFIHEKELTSIEELTPFLRSATYFQAHLVDKEKEDPQLNQEIRNALYKLRLDIQKILTSRTNDTIFHHIQYALKPKLPKGSWKEAQYPLFISEEHDLALNVLEGKFYFQKRSMTKLSRSVIQSAEYQDIFGPHIYTYDSPALNTIEFYDETHRRYRIIMQSDSHNVFQTERRPGEWVQYIPKSTFIGKQGKNIYSKIGTLGLVHDHLQWITQDDRVLITDKKRKQFSYEVTFSGTGNKLNIKTLPSQIYDSHLASLSESSTKTKQTPLQLHLVEETPFDFLIRFESPEYIHIWGNKTHNIEKIEFPRFKDLTFKITKVNGKGRIQCDFLPDYSMAKKQHVPALGDYSRFILLEDQTGKKKKVLVPFQEVYSENNARSLDTNYKLDQQMKEERIEPQSYITYDLDANGDLQAENLKGYFYLAYLSLFKQDYHKAHQILRHYGRTFNPYTQEEIEVLIQILKLEQITHDHDPRNIALNLYVYYLFLQNYDKGNATYDAFDKESMIELFKIYLNQLQDTTRFQLKPEEEISLIEYLTPTCKTTPMHLVNRLTALDPLRGKQLIAKCAIKNAKDSKSFAPDFVSQISRFDIECAFSIADHCTYSWEITPKKGTGLKMRLDKRYFVSNFLTYYEQAKNTKTPSAKAEFEYEINLYRYSNGDDQIDIEPMRSLLLMVARNPEAFPEAKTIQTYFENRSFNHKFDDEVLKPYRQLIQKQKGHHGHFQRDQLEKLTKAEEKSENPTSFSSESLKHISFNSSSIQTNLSRILKPSPLESSDLSHFEKTQKELPAIFDQEKHSDPFIQMELNTLTEECKAFLKNPPEKKFELQQNADLETIHKEIQQEIIAKEKVANEMHLQMLMLANFMPQEPTTRSILHLQTDATYRKPISEDDLLLLFLRKELHLYKQANSALSKNQIVKLHTMVGNYLVHMTSIQHLRRSSFRLKQLEKALEKQENGDLLIQAYAAQAYAQRNYVVDQHPEYLVFEYYADILIYPFQVEKLEELFKAIAQNDRKKMGIILEMIMSSGKSKVLLPLLGLINADGKHLSMIIMPHELIHSIGSDLQETFREAFNQTVDHLQFKRNIQLSLTDLRRIDTKLEMIQKNKKVLLITSKSLQILYLKYLETFYHYTHSFGKEKNEWEKKLVWMRKIINRLKTQGLPIFDEADLLLNCRHEVHFTMGAGEKIKDLHLDLIQELYHILLSEKIATFDFTSEEADKTFTPLTYQKELRPIIAQSLIESLATHSFGLMTETVNAYFQGLNSKDREKVYHYLLNDPHAIGVQAFINAIPNRQIQDLLALAKEEINTIFALTANRNIDEHYGFSPDPNVYPLAIPYHKGHPVIGSQFGNPYETINYSIQLYYKKGIPSKILFEKILSLRNQALNELRMNPNLGLKKTQAYAEYQNLNPSSTPQSFFSPKEKEAEKITEKINANPSKKLDFIRRYILTKLEIYPKRLSSNPQVFGRLLNKLFGFTGTLWNQETFPVGLEGRDMKGTTGKTLTYLWMKSPQKVHVISDTNILESVETLFKEQAHALVLIDAAGIFRGMDHEMITRSFLAKVSERDALVDHALYFDEEGYLKMISKDQKKAPQLFSESNPSTRISIYDQKHTTGADIKQSEDAIAFVSIGRHTLLRDLLQAVWRMRGLGRSQSVIFFMTEEDRKLLTEFLGKEASYKPTLQDILLFAAYHQMQKKGEDNYLNMKQKIKAVFENALFELLLDETLPFEEIEQFASEVEAFFLSNVEETPFLQYGQMEEKMPKEQVIEKDRKIYLSKNLGLIQKNPFLASKLDPKALEVDVNHIIKNAYLPSALLGSQDQTLATEIEVMQEKKIKVKTKIKQKTLEKVATEYLQPMSPYKWQPKSGTHLLENLIQFGSLEKLNEMLKFPIPHPISAPPIFTLSDCLSTNEDLKKIHKAFDPSIGATFNFMPLKKFKPLSRFQKIGEEVLIIESPGGKLKLIMLDQYDADFFKKAFMKKSFSFPKDTKLCLYNLYTGSIQKQPGYAFDGPSLAQDSNLQKLLVQVKFANGELLYSLEEIALLKEWLKENNPKEMFDFFYGQILKWRPHDQNRFYNSNLYCLFKELNHEVFNAKKGFSWNNFEKWVKKVFSYRFTSF